MVDRVGKSSEEEDDFGTSDGSRVTELTLLTTSGVAGVRWPDILLRRLATITCVGRWAGAT